MYSKDKNQSFSMDNNNALTQSTFDGAMARARIGQEQMNLNFTRSQSLFSSSSSDQESISLLSSPDYPMPIYVNQTPPIHGQSSSIANDPYQNIIYTSAEIGYLSSPADYRPNEIDSWPPCRRSTSVTSAAGSDSSKDPDYSLKRARNNQAVKKSRAKTKAQREELEAKCEEQKTENDRLKERLEELEKDLDFEKRKSLHLLEAMSNMSHRNANANSTSDKATKTCKHCSNCSDS